MVILGRVLWFCSGGPAKHRRVEYKHLLCHRPPPLAIYNLKCQTNEYKEINYQPRKLLNSNIANWPTSCFPSQNQQIKRIWVSWAIFHLLIKFKLWKIELKTQTFLHFSFSFLILPNTVLKVGGGISPFFSTHSHYKTDTPTVLCVLMAVRSKTAERHSNPNHRIHGPINFHHLKCLLLSSFHLMTRTRPEGKLNSRRTVSLAADRSLLARTPNVDYVGDP